MEAVETGTNGKATKSSASGGAEDKPKRQRQIPEPGEAMKGESLGVDTITRRYSTKGTTWKKLVTLPGVRTFSRSPDGKFVYLMVSKSRAISLDGLEPLTVPSDEQGMTVYRVWLSTF